MEYGQLDGVALPITPFCGCGRCVIAVRRLSRKTDATSLPDRQARQVIGSVDDIGGHIIGWADDWEVSGAVNPLERPALEPWLRDERGPYAGIVGADVSRIGRDVRDILNTGWMMKDTGRLLITADHGVWDLADPAQENQFMAQAWGAQMELRAIQKRNSDAAVNAWASGTPRGLNSYGYRFVRLIPTGKVDHVETDPEAAATIREVAQRILDDESGTITVATEAVRLNRAGVLAPRDHRGLIYGREPKGYLWSDKALKLILTSQAALGYLIHEGKPVLRPDGHPVRSADPLWDHPTHMVLVKKLTAKRPTGTRAPRGLRLLAGRAFCGACQRRLHVSTLVLRNGDQELRYICNGRIRGVPQSVNCKPAPTMFATDMERIVTDKFLAEWGDTPLLRREFDPGTGYAARIAELERDQERLERDRAAGLFERPDAEARYYENHKRMTAEITEDEIGAGHSPAPEPQGWVMTQVVRAEALHRQLAKIIREAIDDGTYPVGSLLPAEDALGKQHEVSRSTVRLALNTLRQQGLIAVRVGSGSTVLPGPDAKAVTIWRTTEAGPDRLTDIGDPDRFRSAVGERLADLLNLDADEPTFVQVVRGTDPETGHNNVITTRVLPFSACERTSLETESFPDRPTLLAILTKAHGKLATVEYVRPLIPSPGDATMLDLPEGTPILETTRVTQAGSKGVVAEIERTGGNGIQHAYRVA